MRKTVVTVNTPRLPARCAGRYADPRQITAPRRRRRGRAINDTYFALINLAACT